MRRPELPPLPEVIVYQEPPAPVAFDADMWIFATYDRQNGDIDPRVAGPIVTCLKYQARLAAGREKRDEGLLIEEIRQKIGILAGERAITVTLRKLVDHGFVISHPDPGGGPWRYSLHVRATQEAVRALEKRGDRKRQERWYLDTMLTRLKPDTSKRIEVRQPEPAPAAAPTQEEPTPEAVEAARRYCPKSPANECALAARHCGGSNPPAESNPDENCGKGTQGGVQDCTPPSRRSGKRREKPCEEPQSEVIEWMRGLGVSKEAAARLAGRHTEAELRSWWDWAPYYAERVGDRVAMFVKAADGNYGMPTRYKRAQQTKRALESGSEEQSRLEEQRALDDRDREETTRRVEAFVEGLPTAEQERFQREAERRLRAQNAFVWQRYEKGMTECPIVAATMLQIRAAIVLEWSGGEGSARAGP